VSFIFPGWALQEELALYVEKLDYTPREAIEAITRESAEFMEVRDTVGTIEPGQRADLVLLNANPLDDIHNTKEIEAVFLRGRHLGRAALDSTLESVKSEPDVLRDDWGRYVEDE
jgi:imidazolonepropionase-like amidohydrolase